MASDVLEDFVDGAGDVDRGRHAEEHDGGDDVRERGRVTGAGALGDWTMSLGIVNRERSEPSEAPLTRH